MQVSDYYKSQDAFQVDQGFCDWNGAHERASGMGSKVFFLFLKKKIIYLFIWLRWVFVAAHGLSLVAVSGGYSLLRCAGFSLQWLLLLQSTVSRHAGFSSCDTWAQ